MTTFENTNLLLDEDKSDDYSKYVYEGFKDKKIYDFYIKQRENFWIPNEIDLSDDYRHWENLNVDEQNYIKLILAFFAASDGIVNENLALRFYADVQLVEAKWFYVSQMYNENIHSETYSLLIQAFVKNNDEKNKLFHAIKSYDFIRKKAEWAKKYIHSIDSFDTRLVAFACVEGIFFSSSFCGIYWLKKRGLMPGLCLSNEFISRDESLHCDFAIYVHSKYGNTSITDIENIIREASEIEIEFVKSILPINLVGMNSDLMCQYVRFVTNRISIQLGINKIYPDVINPFPWMERISYQSKTNFFDRRVSEYSLPVKTSELKFNEEF